MKKIRAFILASALLLVFAFSESCVGGEEDIYSIEYGMAEAYMMVDWAVKERETKCGERPPDDLLVLGNTPKFAVDACVYMLIKEDCPFTEYPVACYEIYGIDIPGIGP